MTTDDQTLEGGASGSAEELELEPKVPEVEHEEPGGDPLDDIKDEAARAEAKKHRAIARRGEKREMTPEKKPEQPVAPKEEFLTKSDFYKSNERKAIREATADAEVKANWNEIVPFYTPRRGKETPEDIMEDIRDAITIFNARNAKSTKDNGVDALTATPVAKTGGHAPGKQSSTATPPLQNFQLPTQPKDWYSKKK